jgi:glycosyltransferase involved in cell wall biosynthesis
MESEEQRVRVSVLMTAYNRESYIAQAIESVLASTLVDFELIIVDDCSNDSTVAISRRYIKQDSRVKVFVNEKNLGDYYNRNRAASYAIGKYIKYLDSDDVMYPNCLEVMVNSMEKFPDASFGLSAVGNSNKPYPFKISPKEAYLQHFYGFGHFDRAPGSAIILKKSFDEIGGFQSAKYIGDTQLWFLLAQKYNLVLFQRDLIWDRIHGNSESSYEKADKKISNIRKELVIGMLRSELCPLSEKEIEAILNKNFKYFKTCKNLFQKIIGKND